MATFNAETYAAQLEAQTNAGKMISTAELISGKVSYLQAKWKAPAGGIALGDIVNLAFLPSGMTVVPDQSTLAVVARDATGTAAHQLSIDCDGVEEVMAIGLDFSSLGTFLLGNFNEANVPLKCHERSPIFLTAGENIPAGTEIRIGFFLVNSN